MIEKVKKIQAELKVPKNQFNKFGNYHYRSCEDIVEAVKPLCHREGLYLTLSDEIIEVGGRVYVKATAALHDGTISITVDGVAREPEQQKGMADPQITGSASSYARKYALNGLFAIDDTKDADATNDHGKTTLSPEQACANLSKAATLDELKSIFMALPKNLQSDVEVVALKDEIKKKLTV